ncbi:BtrH N-terminal domain-containing protein [Streptococcus mutans]|uniref:BtrH N-terminal domain-containing protein n=1 Tax=Streptococcus mutans TaxID=1309 RepID=UPI001ED997E0|nr:BtrH N-terminal domain-containing protein [Streptococcus mutans]MCY7128693.1 BtrH N-terminal domain-containing protein [Streptococcus mutans]MDW5544018.1 BtrH N-terminal domain-containing protein [Streptococcus mutans]MDW5547746.1 BtrH N-terminal domain-containing protein [Streptococcus mutans]
MGTLLTQLSIYLSEPMIFGLGEGLGFAIFNMKTLDFPFIGGRIKPDLLTVNLSKNLGLKLITNETNSKNKAWKTVKSLIDSNKAVGLKLDCYHLDYFSNPIHFAAHHVAMLGYDDKKAYLVDTKQQGTKTITSLESLALARNEKGPMSSRNKYFEKETALIPIETAILKAVCHNSETYLNPPIKNFGYKGIEKASREIIKWFKQSKDIQKEFAMSALLMKSAGTGGALFRNFYRDFLKEAYEWTGHSAIKIAYEIFKDSAKNWSRLILLFEKAGKTGDIQYVLEASKLLKDLSLQEKEGMQLLNSIKQM